jgi:lysophospholipase L1-like esterase
MSSNGTVAFVGSSTVAGRGQVFDVIGELRRRPENAGLTLLNFGVGGDSVSDAVGRLPRVIAAHPDKVVVIIGGNDILTTVFPNLARVLSGWNRIRQPTTEQFRANLRELVHQLKTLTSAWVAVASLGQVGENPASTDPVQGRLNELYEQYRQIVRQVATDESVYYIPFYEELHKQIQASSGRSFTSFRLRSLYWDTFQHYIFRRRGDDLAAANGWRFHVDGVHLNSRGGLILANAIQDFLDRSTGS